MSEFAELSKSARPPSRRKSLVGLAGLIATSLAFYATWSGHVRLPSQLAAALPGLQSRASDFVALEPVMISLPPATRSKHLRFSAQLEVAPQYLLEVTEARPRIIDLLHGYFRALDPQELERQTSLLKIRVQLLRRIQAITGDGRVKDILISEFLLS